MKRVVQAFSNLVRELVDKPIVPHAEVTLHDALAQVVTAMGLHRTEREVDHSLEIEGQVDSVRYVVAIRDLDGFTRKLTAYMMGPRSSGGWGGHARWERGGSMTWAASQMPTGLAKFRLKEIAIIDNGFDGFESLIQPNGDVEALAALLGYLSATHTLRLKLNCCKETSRETKRPFRVRVTERFGARRASCHLSSYHNYD